jgi:hypothetical protein
MIRRLCGLHGKDRSVNSAKTKLNILREKTIEQFKYAFDPKAMEAFVARMERNEGISSQFVSNEQLRNVAMEWMMKKVFEHFQGPPPSAG